MRDWSTEGRIESDTRYPIIWRLLWQWGWLPAWLAGRVFKSRRSPDARHH